MALVNAARNISSFSDAFNFVDDLTQKVVRIRRKSSGLRGLPFTPPNINPFAVSDKEIFLNVVENEDLEYTVDITEKPIADLGAAGDYVSRTSTSLVLTSVISNRSFNLLSDPYEALGDIARSFAPGVAAGIDAGVGLASEFIDLGGDEMDAKIRNLRSWQVNAEVVEVLGARLDATKHISKNETFTYLIEKIALSYSTDFGDGIGLTLTLKNLLHISEDNEGIKKGGKLGEKKSTGRSSSVFSGVFSNPFAG